MPAVKTSIAFGAQLICKYEKRRSAVNAMADGSRPSLNFPEFWTESVTNGQCIFNFICHRFIYIHVLHFSSPHGKLGCCWEGTSGETETSFKLQKKQRKKMALQTRFYKQYHNWFQSLLYPPPHSLPLSPLHSFWVQMHVCIKQSYMSMWQRVCVCVCVCGCCLLENFTILHL